ncbi:MAG: site-specific integrase [Chloroflexi bacterium]|nr:site-specific integrase [Chloroflexota bacterium]
MNARIRKRGGRYEVFLDVGEQDALRCPACVRVDSKGRERGKLFWMDEERPDACPDCGGELQVVSKRRERWVGSYKRQKEALEARNKATQDSAKGELVDARKLTLAQYLDSWTDGFDQRVADGELKPSTARGYRDHVKLHIKPALGFLRLQDVTTRHVDEFHKELAAKPGRKEGSTLSVNTRRHVHVTLHAALADAKRQRLIGYNPADDAVLPKAKRAPISASQVWTADELLKFLKAVQDDRLGVLWQVMGTTGLRRGEALGLRWDDVDLEHGTLRVRDTRTSVGYEVHEGGPKSEAGKRLVPMLPATTAALKAWKARQNAERLAWGAGWQDTGHVFTRENGEPWHPDRISKLFARAVADAKVPRMRLHDLRHGFATYHIANGTQAKHLQKLMGHSRIGVTLDTYVHPEYEDLAAAQANLAAVLTTK